MPIFYLCVFVAYIGLKFDKKKIKRHKDDYIFIKNKSFGILAGIWLCVVTLVGMLMQMYDESIFIFVLNICIPVVLVGMGVVIPFIAQVYNKRHGLTEKDLLKAQKEMTKL